MKKLLINSIIVGALFSSCGLTEEPVGVLNEDSALNTLENIVKYRNGFYNCLRSTTAGAFIGYTEIQADMFIGLSNNGNNYGIISLGNIGSETTDLTGAWSSPYAYIQAVNYFLPYVEERIASDEISDEEKIELTRYRGEAKWTRAYLYYFLADHYCQSYTLENVDGEATGLPIVTVYDPSGDYATYPGRSTLRETFAQIDQDLNEAYDDLMVYENTLTLPQKMSLRSPNAYYLNTCIVSAFQARIALLEGDYATAIDKAKIVLSNTNYSLATVSNYSQLWTNDQGKELLFVLYGDQGQASGVPATGTIWLSNTYNPETAWYVPTANALKMYDAENDVRYEAFFEERSLNIEGDYYYAPCFVKFPGNPSLDVTSTTSYKNLPKPFRLSETYLILAEAYAATSDETNANKYLNTLRKNRIRNYTEETYSGPVLVNEIREERAKELIGEGFRISDLRRWKLGFSRSIDYPSEYSDVADIIVPAGAAVTYPVGDHKYVWPIPKDEMEANPQIASQQNPGY